MNFFRRRADRQLIGAHRGNRSVRPENTGCAFEASLGRCDFIELDVQMSEDGIPVIHHDHLLGRTCNARRYSLQLAMKSLQINDWPLEQLSRLDFGTWFIDDDPFQSIANGVVQADQLRPLMPQPLMTLEDLLAWRNLVGIPLNIELKDQKTVTADRKIVAAVVTAIRHAGCVDEVIFSSFNHDYLKQITAILPEAAIGVLATGSHPPDLLNYLRDIGADAYHPEANITDAPLIAELRAQGLGINVFTVNDHKTRARLLAAGATAIFTDFPDLERTA